MNQGRIWCVVNPTVGLPLFLGSVAVTSLIVHFAVLGNTAWFGAYLNGHAKVKAASVEGAAKPLALNPSPGVTISVAPVAGNSATAETSFVLTVSPSTGARAVADDGTTRPPEALALAAPGAR